nr:ATPase subunit 8 [Eriocaulon australe]
MVWLKVLFSFCGLFVQSIMPQLDLFSFCAQFFWLSLLLFTFYIIIFNNGYGLLGISRIIKLRNHLHSPLNKNIRSNHRWEEDISITGLNTGVSYMYSSLFEVSQWCVHSFGKWKQIAMIHYFGETSGSRSMDRTIFYLISKLTKTRITFNNDIMFIHVPHGQVHW